MHGSVALSIVFIVSIAGAFAISCPNSPANWCETKEIAQACGVTEQCQTYIWKVQGTNDKVNFSLYYETLCPYCQQFITEQLTRAYSTIPDIINITIVPYGNAHETYDSSSQMYQFTCQHGPDECVGNLIHSCALFYYPTIAQYFAFVTCTESSSGDMRTVAKQCAEKSQLDYSKIDACTQGKLGNQLQHTNALRTESLQPPHKYVPWVTVNGQHTEEMEDEALNDLVKLICKTYKGSNPPAACSQY